MSLCAFQPSLHRKRPKISNTLFHTIRAQILLGLHSLHMSFCQTLGIQNFGTLFIIYFSHDPSALQSRYIYTSPVFFYIILYVLIYPLMLVHISTGHVKRKSAYADSDHPMHTQSIILGPVIQS